MVAVGGDPVLGVDDLQRLLTGDLIDRRVDLAIFRGGTSRRLALVPRELASYGGWHRLGWRQVSRPAGRRAGRGTTRSR